MKRRVSLTITDEQYEYARRRRINLSAFLRKCLDREMYVDVRVWKIAGEGRKYRMGTHLRLRREEWERLPSNRLGRYIEEQEGDDVVRYYVKEMVE